MDRSKPGRATERWLNVREPENSERSEISGPPGPESGVTSHISHSVPPGEEPDWGRVG